jgi:hypothetical protein
LLVAARVDVAEVAAVARAEAVPEAAGVPTVTGSALVFVPGVGFGASHAQSSATVAARSEA